jgi:hypothetical protein
MVGAGVRVERGFDLLADKVFPPVDAVRVDMLQLAQAVAPRERRFRRVP